MPALMKTPILLLAILVAPGRTNEATQALKAFVDLANRRAYAEAEKYMTPEALSDIRKSVGTFTAYCDAVTRNGQVESVVVDKHWDLGDEVTLRYRVTFPDGLDIHTVNMRKTGNTWQFTKVSKAPTPPSAPSTRKRPAPLPSP